MAVPAEGTLHANLRHLVRELCSDGDGLPDTLVDALTELSLQRKIVRKLPMFSATEEGIMKALEGSGRKEKLRHSWL